MSVDPLADKYPNVTPYLYCNGNPVMLVDPDGRDWYETDENKIVWQDDPAKAPDNYTHIGTNEDLLAYYGLSSYYGEKDVMNYLKGTSSGYYKGNGVLGGSMVKGTVNLTAEVAYSADMSKATDNNSIGLQFEGITISAALGIYINNSSGSDLASPYSASLSVKFGGGSIIQKGFSPISGLWDGGRFSECKGSSILLTPQQIGGALGSITAATVKLGRTNGSSFLPGINNIDATWNLQTNSMIRFNYQNRKM